MSLPISRMWPHLPEDEEDRRVSLAHQLIGSDDEAFDEGARAVASLFDLVVHGGDELLLYANSHDWPFGGAGASYWSLRLCDIRDIRPDGTWPEGEAAELDTDRSRFEALIATEDVHLWQIMAANPRCPGDLLERLVTHDVMDYDREQVRYCAAHNPATPPLTLAWLIDRDYSPNEESDSEDDDPDTEVRLVALRNPATPSDILIHWSEFQGDDGFSDGWQERSAVAENWATPDEVLTVLAQDSMPLVRAAVAANPCSPMDLIEALSLDTDERGTVLKAVLRNPSSSERARTQAALGRP